MANRVIARPSAAFAAVSESTMLELGAPLITALAVTVRQTRSAIDPDLWWHLATGRWIIGHARVPMSDPFSATHGGQTWYAHEWLAELGIGLADRAAGYAGAALLTLAITIAGAWLLMRA